MEATKRITPAEYMKITGFKRNKVYKLCHIESFPSVKIGRDYFIDFQRAEEWLKKMEAKGVKL